MRLMALGPMLFLRECLSATAQMRGYALSLVEDLHPWLASRELLPALASGTEKVRVVHEANADVKGPA